MSFTKSSQFVQLQSEFSRSSSTGNTVRLPLAWTIVYPYEYLSISYYSTFKSIQSVVVINFHRCTAILFAHDMVSNASRPLDRATVSWLHWETRDALYPCSLQRGRHNAPCGHVKENLSRHLMS